MVITAACVNFNDDEDYPPCGMLVYSGVPVLDSGTLEKVIKKMQEINVDAGSTYEWWRKEIIGGIVNITTTVLNKMFGLDSAKLQAAGIQTLQIDNGKIHCYNVSEWHAASPIPFGVNRVFLGAWPSVGAEGGEFVEHAKLDDGSRVMFAAG
jgi:hypothetical protein